MENIQDFIPKDIPRPIVGILDKEEKELFEEVRAKAKEEFDGRSKAFKNIVNGIDFENINGSQFFFNIYLNKFLPKEKRVINLYDVEAIINCIGKEYFEDMYCDTTDLILRSTILEEPKNKYILENLVEQLKYERVKFSKEEPVIISGLELIKDSNPKNEYGLLLKLGQDTDFRHDSRFAYSSFGDQKFGNISIEFHNGEDGLSRVGPNGGYMLKSDSLCLIDSDKDDRIAVIDKINYPKGLQEYLNIIEFEKQFNFEQAKRELEQIQSIKRNFSK